MNTRWSALPLTETRERVSAWDEMLLEIVKSLSLPESKYKKLEGHYDAIAQLLQEPKAPELSDLQIFPQGSVMTRTLVRPLPGCDVDVDAIAFRPQGTTLSPREWLDCLLGELSERARTQGEVTRKKRCVTVQYDDKDLPAHVDVTPAKPSPGNSSEEGRGCLEVPDYPSNSDHPASPRDFGEWVLQVSRVAFPLSLPEQRLVEAKSEVQQLPTYTDMIALDPLRLVIKLAKRHRDVYARANQCVAHQPLSIILTTLIGRAFLTVGAELRRQGRAVSTIESLRLIADRIPSEFEASHPRWLLRNPCRPDENFAEKWNHDPRYAAVFFEWHGHFKRAIELGLRDFGTRREFEDSIEAAFGVEPKREVGRMLAEAAKHRRPMAGVSAGVAENSYNAERNAGALMGLAAATPNRAQEPPDLNKLG